MHASTRGTLFLMAALSFSVGPLCAQDRTIMTEQETVRSSRGPRVRVTEESTLGRPKYKERIKDLGDQIRLVQSKGFISQEENDKFLERQSKLVSMEQDARKNGFPKAETDELERQITVLNADLFKASHKDNPIKPGQAEEEVNDPNLIPAYPDKDLQPGSGKVSEPKTKEEPKEGGDMK